MNVSCDLKNLKTGYQEAGNEVEAGITDAKRTFRSDAELRGAMDLGGL